MVLDTTGSMAASNKMPTLKTAATTLINTLSRTAKEISSRLLGNKAVGHFNSFRLIDGEIGRTLAAYCRPDNLLRVDDASLLPAP